MKPKKSLQELTLLNRFLFDETIERPGNLQTMLEIILGEDIVLQCFPQPEKEQQRSPNRRSVRLDVWAQDVTGTVYDAEVQRRNEGNLPKRSRYYLSMIDSDLLKPGTDDFDELNPVIIIFITPFDLFGEERYRYTFSAQCKEVPGIQLEDGATRIFLNTHGTDDENISPELKELLDFMEHTNDEDHEFRSKRVEQLKKSVREIQKNEEVSMRYLHELEEQTASRREGREEGREEGLAEGMEKGMEKLLLQQIERKLKKGQSVDQIADALEEPPERIQEIMDKIMAESVL